MQPLSEFYYFAKVIEHGGYARAARALRIPKSRLSRHLSALETRLGVRLVNRSTRRFAVTDLGREVYAHATAMLEQADAALRVVEVSRAEPCGTLRIACPVALAQTALAGILPEFLAHYPRVRVVVQVSNRRADVLGEGLDAAIRVRTQPSGEDGLVMRSFGQSSELLVASPSYLSHAGAITHPEQLAARDTLAFSTEADPMRWDLTDEHGAVLSIAHSPRLMCHDFVVLRQAVLTGLGVALLPESVVRADLAAGTLERVLPGLNAPIGVLHVVFPTRRGMSPALRAFIDLLAERLPAFL